MINIHNRLDLSARTPSERGSANSVVVVVTASVVEISLLFQDSSVAGICEHLRNTNNAHDCGGTWYLRAFAINHRRIECSGVSICDRGLVVQIITGCGGNCLCDHGKTQTHVTIAMAVAVVRWANEA